MVHPKPLSEHVRKRMSLQSAHGTKPELALRRGLHADGFRYRIDYPVPDAPRRSIDVAFPKQKIAVFVDGCFWHGCPKHAVPQKNNAEWWASKLATNKLRDSATTAILEAAGWRVIRLWEHTSVKDMLTAVKDLWDNEPHADTEGTMKC